MDTTKTDSYREEKSGGAEHPHLHRKTVMANGKWQVRARGYSSRVSPLIFLSLPLRLTTDADGMSIRSWLWGAIKSVGHSHMDCGGKRSATPLWLVFVSYPSQDQPLKPKRRRASLAAALHRVPGHDRQF